MHRPGLLVTAPAGGTSHDPIGPLSADFLLPSLVQQEVSTGGGSTFGWTSETIRLR